MKEIAGLEKAQGELVTECGQTKETLIRIHNENVRLLNDNAKLDNQGAEAASSVNTLKELTGRNLEQELCELLHMMDLIRAKATRISMMNNTLRRS